MSSGDEAEERPFFDAPEEGVVNGDVIQARAASEARPRRERDVIGHVPASRFRSRSRSRSQSRGRAPTPPASAITTTYPDSVTGTFARRIDVARVKAASHKRHSLPAVPTEPVPSIPERFLEIGRPASLNLSARQETAQFSVTTISTSTSNSNPTQRPSTSGGESTKESRAQSFAHALAALTSSRKDALSSAQKVRPASDNSNKRGNAASRHSLQSLRKQASKTGLAQVEGSDTDADMSWLAKARNEDLFLEMANERAGTETGVRSPSRSERVSSRLSFTSKRHSLPQEPHLASTDRRPRSSGQLFANRPASRVETRSTALQQHVDRYRAPSSYAALAATDDVVSQSARSRAGRQNLYSGKPDQASPSSPPSLAERINSSELPPYDRRRPSFTATPPQSASARAGQNFGKLQDALSDSPAEDSEPKRSQPDSASIDSPEADTVWDELDDLKFRIKKLELTGKLPPTSGGTISNESSETRPRTATTAPTTIDSSPKHEKAEKIEESVAVETTQAQDPAEYTVGGPATANIHPLLHAALAKAKPLLSGSLYRTLEATAADALQLAAMTGSAGPQGTVFSAASIINSVAVADRHMRRKADTMCRNLTDLCLALCDGKIEAPSSITASPVTLDIPPTRSLRSSLGATESLDRFNSRPMSRLEARRTSILGTSVNSSSPRDRLDDAAVSDQDGTPSSHPQVPALRRVSRASSRLQVERSPRYHDGLSGDEDPTLRPASRAFTDAGRALRPHGPRDYNSPSQRSPSLRDSLVARRDQQQQQLSRVSSLTSESSRRRFLDHSTPPVLEEESVRTTSGPETYVSPVLNAQERSKRRVMSYGQFASGGRRATEGLPNRATSLNQRRHIVVE